MLAVDTVITPLSPTRSSGEDPQALVVGTVSGGYKGIWMRMWHRISVEYIIITILHICN